MLILKMYGRRKQEKLKLKVPWAQNMQTIQNKINIYKKTKSTYFLVKKNKEL